MSSHTEILMSTVKMYYWLENFKEDTHAFIKIEFIQDHFMCILHKFRAACTTKYWETAHNCVIKSLWSNDTMW